MSKIKRKLQFAGRREIFLFNLGGGKFDIISRGYPCDLALTKREAVNSAYQAACRNYALKVYITKADGMTHKAECDEVSYYKPGKKCKCRYLPQNQS